MGRPPFYDNSEDMKAKIDQYFIDKDEDNPPLVEELAQFLGYADYRGLWECQQKPEFLDIIKEGKNRCGLILNKLALRNKVNARIASLNLSANHNLHEKKEHEISGKDGGPLSIQVEFIGND